MIHVVATLTIDPAKRAEFIEAFKALTPEVLAEEGCLEYGLTVDQPTPVDVQQLLGDEAVMVIEKWESTTHLENHLAAPHMAKFFNEMSDTLRDVKLLVLKPA